MFACSDTHICTCTFSFCMCTSLCIWESVRRMRLCACVNSFSYTRAFHLHFPSSHLHAHIHTCSHRTHTCNHTQTGRQVVSSVKAYICRAHGICKALCPKNELHRSTQSTIISTKKRNTLNRFWCVGDTLAQKRIGSKKQFEL